MDPIGSYIERGAKAAAEREQVERQRAEEARSQAAAANAQAKEDQQNRRRREVEATGRTQWKVFKGRGITGEVLVTNLEDWEYRERQYHSGSHQGGSHYTQHVIEFVFRNRQTTNCEELWVERMRGPFWNRYVSRDFVGYFLADWALTVPIELKAAIERLYEMRFR